MPDSNKSLAQQFINCSVPEELYTSLKFRVLDKEVFEIDVKSNMYSDDMTCLETLINQAVKSAVVEILKSAK